VGPRVVLETVAKKPLNSISFGCLSLRKEPAQKPIQPAAIFR